MKFYTYVKPYLWYFGEHLKLQENFGNVGKFVDFGRDSKLAK